MAFPIAADINTMQNPKNPLLNAVKEERECILAKSSLGWAKQNSQSSMCAASQSLSREETGKNAQLSSNSATRLCCQSLGTHCREWPAGIAGVEVLILVKANSKANGVVIYTDASTTKDRSGWGFTVKQGAMILHEDSGMNGR